MIGGENTIKILVGRNVLIVVEILCGIEARWVGSPPQLLLQDEDGERQVDPIAGPVTVPELQLLPLFLNKD